MQEQNALIGVAVAGYFPEISLTGLIEFIGRKPLPFHVAHEVWALGASASQPLFDGVGQVSGRGVASFGLEGHCLQANGLQAGRDRGFDRARGREISPFHAPEDFVDARSPVVLELFQDRRQRRHDFVAMHQILKLEVQPSAQHVAADEQRELVPTSADDADIALIRPHPAVGFRWC